MSYQTPVLQQITSPPQALAEVVANTNGLATQHQAVYALDEVATSGLNLWLIAGRWGGFAYTPAALTLTASATNYVVVAIATGVPSVSTATTNWNDATNYVRVYQVTTGTTAITAVADSRAGPRGVHGGAGGGASGAMTYIGTWNASTNTPTLTSSTGTKGYVYKVSTAGTTTLDGISAWAVGDEAVFNGTTWDRISGGNSGVTSPLTTKGDLFGYSTVGARVPIGSDGQVLTADSTQPLGLKWGAPATGAAGIAVNTLTGSSPYTTVLSDANGAIYRGPTSTTTQTAVIAANASVPYPIGTAITFDNDYGAGILTISINTDTLVMVGTAGSTGSRTLVPGGQATALKVASTRWRINGTGLS